MAYHGEDLDLRTPQSLGVPAGDYSASDAIANGARGRARGTPILVDDVLLACCNHAYDVAVAHKAGEVRLEHLLHALTRVEGASTVLEARGIRVASLRRESATIIAGEIPIGLNAGQGRPRRSDDMEHALRSASLIALRRNAPANVDDLIDALLDMPSDVPGIALLARHGGRGVRDRQASREAYRDWEAPLHSQPLPPLSRGAALTHEPRGRTTRAEIGQSVVDGMQNARIESLEASVRALAAEIINERKAEREDTSRFRGGLADRLQALENMVAQASGSAHVGLITDRVAQIERNVEDRIAELSHPWAVLSDRLQALEKAVVDTRGGRNGEVMALGDRLAMLERSVQKGFEAAQKTGNLDQIAQRLDIIEEAVLTAAPSDETTKLFDKAFERMRHIEELINTNRSVGIETRAAVNSEIKNLAASVASQGSVVERIQSIVNERVQSLVSAWDRQRHEATAPLLDRISATNASLESRMQALAGVVERQRSEIAFAVQQTQDRLKHEIISGLTETISQQVGQHVGTLISSLDGRHLELSNALAAQGNAAQSATAALQERADALAAQLALGLQRGAETHQEVLSAHAQYAAAQDKLAVVQEQTTAAQAQHTAELREVHEALIKLNKNQHTLAGSIDQWRLDGVGDISVIANRLDTIERGAAQPVKMIEHLTTSVDNISRATVERYHRRNRFWYWLFGTDDWLTASWPSQTAAIEAERAALSGNANLPTVKIIKP